MLVVNFDSGDWVITTTGSAIDTFTDARQKITMNKQVDWVAKSDSSSGAAVGAAAAHHHSSSSSGSTPHTSSSGTTHGGSSGKF